MPVYTRLAQPPGRSATSRASACVVDQKANPNRQRNQADRAAGQHLVVTQNPRQRKRKENQTDAGRYQHDRSSARPRQALHRVFHRFTSSFLVPNNLSMSSALIPRATIARRCSARSLCSVRFPYDPGDDGYDRNQ